MKVRSDTVNFSLIPLPKGHIAQFKADMQRAFQFSAEQSFGKTDEIVLPESDIDHSLAAKGAMAYEAVADGEAVGGAIVVIDEKTMHNHLDFLFVKVGVQSKGIGQAIWNAIEKLYPETKMWETCTTYFEKRNIHFYINKCKFKVVEFYNDYHPDPAFPEDHSSDGDYFEGMFRFEKVMK